MAAEYGININVRTKDEQLKRLQKNLTAADRKVASLNKQLTELEKKTKGGKDGDGRKTGGPFSNAAIDARKKLAKATELAQHNFEKYTRSILNSESANRKGIASTRELATRMKDVAASAGVTSDKFELFTQGFTKLNFSAQVKSLQRFNESAKITASTFGAMSSGNVPGIAGFSNTNLGTLLNFTPANTVNAIERYLDTLTMVRKDLDYTESDFKDVTARIKEMNAELKKQRNLMGGDTPARRRRDPLLRRRRVDEAERLRNSLGGRVRGFTRGRTNADRRIRGQVASSALIGGAFPLLFGQGGGAAAGGFLGGASGGLLGGQFGFALSLVGTQLGALVDTTIAKVGELGKAFGKFSQDTTKIVESLGESNTIVGRNIELLEKARGKQAAFDEAVRQTTVILGEKTTRNLKEFGDDATEISSLISKMGLEFLGIIADLNESLRITKTLAAILPGAEGRRLSDVLKNDGFSQLDYSPVGKKTGMQPQKIADFLSTYEQLEGDLGAQLRLSRIFGVDNVRDVRADAKDLIELSNSMMSASLAMEVLNKEEKKNAEINKTRGYLARQSIRDRELLNEKLREFKQLTGEDANEEQIEKFKQIIAATNSLTDSLKTVNDEIEKLDKKLIQLQDPGYRLVTLSQAIGSSFEDSFKGVVKGTMSVAEAFANMANRISDALLDMAASMIATGLQRMFLSAFSNNLLGDLGVNKGDRMAGSRYGGKRAEGGSVSGGKSYIVGEKGPEVFTPGISGGITPNHALGGSTNISVNIDASGTSVEGSEPNGEELGRLVAAAIQSELIKEKRPGGLLS